MGDNLIIPPAPQKHTQLWKQKHFCKLDPGHRVGKLSQKSFVPVALARMGRKPKSPITDRWHGIFSQKRDVADAGRRILSYARDMTDMWVAQKFQSLARGNICH